LLEKLSAQLLSEAVAKVSHQVILGFADGTSFEFWGEMFLVLLLR
jgi:hypothetical protein